MRCVLLTSVEVCQRPYNGGEVISPKSEQEIMSVLIYLL